MIQRETGYRMAVYFGTDCVSASAGPGAHRIVSTPIDTAAEEAVLGEDLSYVGTVSLAGERCVGEYVPLKDQQSNVIGAILIAEAQSAEQMIVRAQIFHMLIVVGIVLLIATILFMILTSWITTPLNYVTNILHSGDAELEHHPLEFPERYRRRKDEVGKLIYSFDRMFKSIQQHEKHQDLFMEITGNFVNADFETLGNILYDTIRQLGTFMKMEYACVCPVGEKMDGLFSFQMWSPREGALPLGAAEQEGLILRYRDEIDQKEISVFSDLQALSIPDGELKTALEAFSLRSALVLPVRVNGEFACYIILASSEPFRTRVDDHVTLLKMLSNVLSDAIGKAVAEKKNRMMAYYDDLTGLPNRRHFNEKVAETLKAARREHLLFSIMFLDLDSFKSTNDAMGHPAGDLLLQAVAERLVDRLPKTVFVSRFGGDEFLLMIRDVQGLISLKSVSDTVIGLFQEPFLLNGRELFVTASAGLAIYPVDGEDEDTLIMHADLAMYAAKANGKNQYAFCTGAMKNEVRHKAVLTNMLYHALNREELTVYYQPQVESCTGRILGLEALLRWNNPQFGMVSPAEFIPLAEQSGLIKIIGQWVLETACRQCREWSLSGYGNIHMAVNLSAVQLRDAHLVESVDRILRQTGLDPAYLELEITETATIHEPDYIIQLLQDLKGLGVSLSIDDFGTEYSSLNRLKLLPVDKLKMDIQFVRGIKKGGKDQAISKAIISLAKSLKLKVIAEGVEDKAQLEFLNQYGCDEVQGFYFYRPMPPRDFEEILKTLKAE